jgi:hypothetical protein
MATLAISSGVLCAAAGWWHLNFLAYNRIKTAPSASPPTMPSDSPLTVSSKELALPEFDSVPIIGAIEGAAVATKTFVDEMTFVLEDSQAQPYRRYRATFTVAGRYPDIRSFVEMLSDSIPNSSLDSIKCARDEIDAPDVSCALTVSAFYKVRERKT